MIGIFAVIADDEYRINFSSEDKDYKTNEDSGKHVFAYQMVLRKFEEDKIWFSNDSYCVMTDGVVVNYESTRADIEKLSPVVLLNHYQHDDLEEYLRILRGSFSGIIIDKKKKTIIAYTDQICSKPLFSYRDEHVAIVSSNVAWIVRFLRDNDIHYELDEVGAYSMITYGYMYGSHTLIKGVNKILDGSIVKIDSHFHIKHYHVLDNTTINTDEEEAIATIDKLFRTALKQQERKNNKHDYIDTIPLSAGMDCRMTSYVFHAITKRSALNFTYSETGEYDYEIPPVMAHELKNRWIFKGLDHGLDLMNIEESIILSDGLIYYAWPAQLIDFLKLINTKSWGVIHTGVLGDVVIGTFVKNPTQRDRIYEIGDGAYSTMLINKLKTRLKVEKCDYEIGMIRNRGFNGACMGYSMTFRYFAEDMSPFLNVDLLDYCLSLPTELRERHNLYYKWIQTYYPQALKYKHNGVTAKGKLKIQFRGKDYRIRAIPDLIISKINSKVNPNYGMNPIQSWYDNNPDLRDCMDTYFFNNISYLDRWKEIKLDTEWLYKKGTAREKIQAISLVGSVKMFFGCDGILCSPTN